MNRIIRIIFSLPKRCFLEFLRYSNSVKYAKYIGVRCGKGCKFIRPNFGTEPYLITIGDHVEIANNVQFITHDGGVWIFRERIRNIDVFGPIYIGNNVFVGTGAIILPGITIGDNSVIGAGAVVTNDIPSGSIVAGIPAKVIKTVDQYFDDVKEKAFYIKNLNPDEKRIILNKIFK